MRKAIAEKTVSLKKKYNLSEVWQSYLLILLPLIGFFVFSAYPILWSVRWSFFNYQGVPQYAIFTGLDNYITAMHDSSYWSSWLTTLLFALFKLPIELPLAMILAVFLNKGLKGSGFYRSVYFMPVIISVAIVGLIFTNIFGYFGVMNGILTKWGVLSESVDWFSNKYTALFVLALGSTWCSFGTNVLYFLAAMQNIDESIYEAARIDGAGRFTLFFKMTLPLMAPVLQTILLLSINGTLHTSDYILATTNGAPAGDTYTVLAYMYGQFVPGFASGTPPIGYGCALGVITAIGMASIAFVYNKLSSKLANLY